MSLPSLRWLQIHRYEQFEPVRIEFSGQENLILGINGAGKTRLLRLIRAVLSLDFGELRDQVFDVEFEIETGAVLDYEEPVLLRARIRNELTEKKEGAGEYPKMMPGRGTALGAHLWLESQGWKMSFELKHGQMTVRDSEDEFVETAPHVEGLLPWSFGEENSEVDSRVRKMYPLCESLLISEADQEFQVLTHDLEYSTGSGGSSARQITVDPQRHLSGLLKWDLIPLLIAVCSAMDRDSAAAGLLPESLGSEYLSFHPELLESVRAAVSASELRLVPKIVRKKSGLLECRGLGLRVRFMDGTEVAESELTFGQRRYLYAGLMLFSHPRTPILIDEVDNGLHPRLVESLLKLLAGRQSFLASHNKIVIDYTNFDGPEDVQRKIHIVQRGKDGRQSVLVLDDETARTVYEKISVAIQSPSDVLLAEGLW